ncbi:MAG: RHS repeat-associated core domain-containing protein [Candidatus Methylacidiphilales bacterium]
MLFSISMHQKHAEVSLTVIRVKQSIARWIFRGMALTVLNLLLAINLSITAYGQTTRFEYDLAGHLIRRIAPDGEVTAFSWDALGRLTSTSDPLGRTTRKFYRADSALERIVLPDNSEIKFENDLSGRRTAIIDPTGNKTTFAYNGNDQIISQTDSNGGITSYTYDRSGKLNSITDRLGRVRVFAYDANGRLTTETWLAPGNGQIVKTIQQSYDSVGNMVTISDDSGSIVMTYDSLKRPLQITATYNGREPFTLTNAYQDTSRLYTTTDSNGITVESRLDENYRLQRLDWHGESIASARVDFMHNALGDVVQVKKFTDLAATQLAIDTILNFGRSRPDIGVLPAVYNADGDTSKIDDFRSTEGHGPLGKLPERKSLRVNISDPLRQVTRLYHTNGAGSILADYQYTHDIAGQLKTETANGDTITYGYDTAGQLLEASHRFQTVQSETFTYDRSGNKLTRNNSPQYSIGTGNRTQSDGEYNYIYDAESNRIERKTVSTAITRTYAYDHRNRLTQITDLDASGTVTQTVAFTYDALDRRIAKSVNNQTIQYFYNTDHIWKEVDPAGIVTRYLVGDGMDQWLARQRPSTASNPGLAWYITDRLGSIRGIASGDGTGLNQTEYTSYGAILNNSNPAVADSFGFTGREWDKETGLYYFRSRYYDQKLGKYLTEDPIGSRNLIKNKGLDEQQMAEAPNIQPSALNPLFKVDAAMARTSFAAGDVNLVRYVFNSPQNNVDPTGLDTTEYKLVSYTRVQVAVNGKTAVRVVIAGSDGHVYLLAANGLSDITILFGHIATRYGILLAL